MDYFFGWGGAGNKLDKKGAQLIVKFGILEVNYIILDILVHLKLVRISQHHEFWSEFAAKEEKS
jgi:hypothetical protein